MPRRSLRSLSANTTPAKSSPTVQVPSASSKRSRATPVKSQYFPKKEKQEVASDDESDALSVPPSPSSIEEELSGYEDEDATATEPSSGEEDIDNFSESDAPPAKRRKLPLKPKRKSNDHVDTTNTLATIIKGKELWRTGITTGLAPGTQVIIDKPKPRAAGKTPYEPHTIHPNTMLFLSDLAQNNDREWFKAHDPDYRTSWADFTSYLECLQEKLIEADETIPELPTKDIIFRVYRDIRFSKDPTPYKAHFSAAWSRTGRKGPYAAYYVQIKPGASFVGGGLWCPEAAPLAKMRRDIDRRPERMKGVLKEEGLRREFFEGVKADNKKVVKAFAAKNAENALKSKPKGYEADHRDIELLRLRSFTVGRRVADEEVLGQKGMERVAQLLACLVPFISYLNSVVMPDEESEDDDDADDAVSDDDGSTADGP